MTFITKMGPSTLYTAVQRRGEGRGGGRRNKGRRRGATGKGNKTGYEGKRGRRQEEREREWREGGRGKEVRKAQVKENTWRKLSKTLQEKLKGRNEEMKQEKRSVTEPHPRQLGTYIEIDGE